MNSIPGVDSIEVQRITPTDTGWVPAGSVPNSIYFGDGRQYNFYQGPGIQGGLYQYRARFNYYDEFGVAEGGPWAVVAVVWTADGPVAPFDPSEPGNGCHGFDPGKGAGNGDCNGEGTAADPVNLATGFETYSPKSDLSIYNPVGLPVVFQRTYFTLSNIQNEVTPGLPSGWSHNYDVSAKFDPTLGGWGNVQLRLPSGRSIWLEPVLSGGTATGAFVRAAGTPFIVTGVPSTTQVGAWTSLTVKWVGETTWTLSLPTTTTLRLSRITSKTGQYLDLAWTGDKLQTVSNQSATVLLSLFYGSVGLISESRDIYGRSVYYAYDGLSRLTSVSQVVPTGTVSPAAKASYGYTATSGSPLGLLSAVVVPSPVGGSATSTTTINYDSTTSKVSSLIDANGNGEFYTYGSNSTIVQRKDPLSVVQLQYTQKWDSQLRDTGIIDASAHSTTIEYLDGSNPSKGTRLTDRDGRITLLGYDSFGNPSSITTPRSVATILTYDYSVWPTGRISQSQRASDTPATFAYFPNGTLNSVTTAKPGAATGTVTTTFTYDSLGNILTVVAPGNNASTTPTTTYNYTTDGVFTQSAAVGQVLTVTDPNGNVNHVRYDGQGRVTTSTDPLGAQTSFTYNIVDQPLQVSLPATGQTGAGHGTVVNAYLWPGGPMSSTTNFNESGTQVKQTFTTYGSEGEVLNVFGNTELSTYTYDALYRIKTLADGNSNVTQYLYDSVGRLSQVTYPGSGVEQYTSYNGEGSILQTIDPRGLITNYTYADPEGYLTNIQRPAAPTLNSSYSYDGFGRLTGVTDGEGLYAMTYGRQDETATETTTYTGVPAKTLTRTYYPNGSKSGLTTPFGNFAFNYDAGGRPTSMTNPAAETTSWSYQADSALSQQTMSNGSKSLYTYNALGQLLTLQGKTSANVILNSFSTFTYNGVGNLLGNALIVPSATTYGGNNTYAYNAKDELTTATSVRGPGFSHTFNADSAGNLTTLRGATYAFNSKNQITGTNYGYDLAGNPTTYNTKVSVFDAENRLTSYGTNYTAGYRQDNLRAWKTSGSTVKTYFLYDSGVPIFEMTSAGALSASNTFGANGLVSRRTGTATIFYLFDERGNTIHRLNSSQAVQSVGTTDAYGLTTIKPPVSGTTQADPFNGMGAQFGYYYEFNPGIFYVTNRYYDPVNARFLTRDSIGYNGGMNLYGYVKNNPIGQVDPRGTDLYDMLSGSAVSGYQRGGFWGHVQAEASNVGTALLDTIGGSTVKSLSTKSGEAAGAGRNGEAVAYGAATVSVIALEAFSWGRAGAMIKAPLAGTKAAGTEFSHFIGESTMKKNPFWQQIFSMNRTIFNGRVVPVWEHAMTDSYRYRFLPGFMKEKLFKQFGVHGWGAFRSYFNRSPDWMRFLLFRPGTSFIESQNDDGSC